MNQTPLTPEEEANWRARDSACVDSDGPSLVLTFVRQNAHEKLRIFATLDATRQERDLALESQAELAEERAAVREKLMSYGHEFHAGNEDFDMSWHVEATIQQTRRELAALKEALQLLVSQIDNTQDDIANLRQLTPDKYVRRAAQLVLSILEQEEN